LQVEDLHKYASVTKKSVLNLKEEINGVLY